MHVRIVRLQPKHPLVVIGLLAVVVAVLLLVLLSAAVAAAAGVALLGGVGMAVRRLRGGRGRVHGASHEAIARLDPSKEILVQHADDMPRLSPESRGR